VVRYRREVQYVIWVCLPESSDTRDRSIRWCLVWDGVKGSSHGAMYRLWQNGANYDDMIANSLNYTRWMHIKWTYKLNLNATVTKRGEPGYDSAYKYDYIYKTIINNANLFTKEADLDLCGDETSWAHGGYGKSNTTGIVFRVIGKSRVTHGGQTVIMYYVSCTQPHAYIHRHKLHDAPAGWIKQGPLEFRRVMNQLVPMIKYEASDSDDDDDDDDEIEMDEEYSISNEPKKITKEPPHFTFDN
jgi:hypothetical protein